MLPGLHQQTSLLGGIPPVSTAAAATALSDAVDMAQWFEVVCTILLGDYGAANDGQISGGVYYATTVGGTYTLITGKGITVANFSGSASNGSYCDIRVNADEIRAMDAAARFIKVQVTPANQLALLACTIRGVGSYVPTASPFARVLQSTG